MKINVMKCKICNELSENVLLSLAGRQQSAGHFAKQPEHNEHYKQKTLPGGGGAIARWKRDETRVQGPPV